MRLDDPQGVEKFRDAYHDGVALLVLGGLSAQNWESLRDEINPDVILGANGTCFEIDDLDFHLVVENLHMAAGRAAKGEERYRRIMEIVSFDHHAKVRMISFLNWRTPILIDDRIHAVKIKRMGELGDDYESQFSRFSFREYGDGFLAGPLFDHPGALTNKKIKFRVGTVGTQLLHLAGILGVRRVHTIGFDLCFKSPSRHHYYNYPKYQPDRFRTNVMFTQYGDIQTQWDWLEGAIWLKETVQPLMDSEGIEWIDHSQGLLDAVEERIPS